MIHAERPVNAMPRRLLPQKSREADRMKVRGDATVTKVPVVSQYRLSAMFSTLNRKVMGLS